MKKLLNHFQKKNGEFIFCLVTTSNDIEFLIKKYESIISKLISIQKKFVIFKFIETKKRSVNRKLKIKNCEIIEIFTKSQFNSYIKGNYIFAIDEISRGLKFFNIRRQLNQKNINLILIMNIGYLDNNTKIQNIDTSLINKYYNIKKLIEKYICRILILINIYPKTQFYFDSNKKIVEHYNNSFLRKLSKKIKLLKLLLNFQIVEKINSNSLVNYNKYKNEKKKGKILFIDGNYKHKDIIFREGKEIIKNKKRYVMALTQYLEYLGKIFNLKICISLHPSSNLKEYKKLFPKFEVKKSDTLRQVYISSIITFHESSAIVDALLIKKKIISLKTELLGKYYYNRTKLYSDSLNLFSIDIDKPINKSKITKNKILEKLRSNQKKLNNYIDTHIKTDGKTHPSEKIVNVISRYILK